MDRRDFFRVAAGSLLLFQAASCTSLKDECEGDCEYLYPYHIDPDLCTGCGLCVPKCRKEAINFPESGRRALIVNQAKCLRCGKCWFQCEFQSVIQVPPPDGLGHFTFYIDLDTCTNCLECHKICYAPLSEGGAAANAIEIFNPDSRAIINQGLCSHCGECVELVFCPNDAIVEGASATDA